MRHNENTHSIRPAKEKEIREIDKRKKIFTFYSFKGGVGRSRALANVAFQLSKARKKVLCVDFDLEAPDLIEFFDKWISGVEKGKILEKPGILDLFSEYKTYAASKDRFKNIPSWRDCINTINLNSKGDDFNFDYIGPGVQDSEYSVRLSNFDWSAFYSDFLGGRFVDFLKKEFCDNYDYILIDSRTGLADISSICSVHFPDALVAVFTASPKGYSSLNNVVKSIRKQHEIYYAGTSKKLSVIPLLTRVDSAESELYNSWVARLGKGFVASCFRDRESRQFSLLENINRTAILYIPWCSYLDDLESERDESEDINSNYYRYSNLIKVMNSVDSMEVDFADFQENISSTIEFVEQNLNDGIFKGDRFEVKLVDPAVLQSLGIQGHSIEGTIK